MSFSSAFLFFCFELVQTKDLFAVLTCPSSLFYYFFYFASQDDVGSGSALGVCMCIKLPVSLWYYDCRMGCFLEQWVLSCLIYYYPSTCSFREFQISSCLQAVLKEMSLMNESMTRGTFNPYLNSFSVLFQVSILFLRFTPGLFVSLAF